MNELVSIVECCDKISASTLKQRLNHFIELAKDLSDKIDEGLFDYKLINPLNFHYDLYDGFKICQEYFDDDYLPPSLRVNTRDLRDIQDQTNAVFSLCAFLYYIITYQRFRFELIKEQKFDNVPDEFKTLLLKGLSVDINIRHSNIAELIFELEEVIKQHNQKDNSMQNENVEDAEVNGQKDNSHKKILSLEQIKKTFLDSSNFTKLACIGVLAVICIGGTAVGLSLSKSQDASAQNDGQNCLASMKQTVNTDKCSSSSTNSAVNFGANISDGTNSSAGGESDAFGGNDKSSGKCSELAKCAGGESEAKSAEVSGADVNEAKQGADVNGTGDTGGSSDADVNGTGVDGSLSKSATTETGESAVADVKKAAESNGANVNQVKSSKVQSSDSSSHSVTTEKAATKSDKPASASQTVHKDSQSSTSQSKSKSSASADATTTKTKNSKDDLSLW